MAQKDKNATVSSPTLKRPKQKRDGEIFLIVAVGLNILERERLTSL